MAVERGGVDIPVNNAIPRLDSVRLERERIGAGRDDYRAVRHAIILAAIGPTRGG